MCKPVHHEVTLPASPAQVYRAYLSSREHAQFTGQSAKMSAKVGGQFTCGDESIEGLNVDLVKDQRIVQAWRLSYWDPGVFSLVTFRFKKKGKGTRVILDHVGIPDDEVAGIDDGWKTYYWEPLRAYFG